MKELIKIQSELKAPKNQFNAFGKYKYRSCEDILESLKPLLSKYDVLLNISDEIKQVGESVFVESTVTLSKDKSAVDVVSKAQAGLQFNKKGMSQEQIFGSASSYARKYALSGLLLLDDSKDADSTTTSASTSKPALTPQSEKWDEVLKWVSTQDNKAEAVKKLQAKYFVSKTNLEILKK